METIKTNKKSVRPTPGVDAVKMMRETREKISKETANMTFAELKAYIKEKVRESRLKPVGQ